ncbi:MAG: GFA family protein [Alphaproteobacteria bacterium]|nr:GFA family protein [Alphaproteobacteria bacterium]
MSHTGGCLCGAVRYRASADPVSVNHCHCVQCRKQTGAAVATWAMFRREDVTFEGALRFFRSSARAERGFCPTCGSALVWRATTDARHIDVSVGTLDHPERTPPTEHLFVRDQLPWLDLRDDLPRHEAMDR